MVRPHADLQRKMRPCHGPLASFICIPFVLFFIVTLLSVSDASSTIRIGALLDTNSVLGARCLAALSLAVQNVNKDPLLLNGTTLQLVPANSNCSAFTGAAAGENVKSTLGRAVLIIWLFVVLIVTSSYTASLTSILTVEQLTPTIQGIAGLVASNVPIGYQGGSFVEEYLLQLNVPKERLVPLNTLTSYAKALKKGPSNGGVGAIVDELPYVQLFLSSECDFTIAGQEFTKSGWGFAFPKGSQLAIDMSTAILELSENGELQQIHDLWLSGYACSSKVQVQSNELNLRSFWGLFLITGIASVFCVVCYIIRMIWQYNKQTAAESPPIHHEGQDEQRRASRFLRGASFLKSLASFIEEAEITEGEERNSRRDSNKSRSSKDRSPVDSMKVSMSERSMDSSARDSLTSTDDGRAELRDLLKELSMTFNAASNKRVEEGITIHQQGEYGMQEQSGRTGNPIPLMTKRLNTLRSFIFRPQISKIPEEGRASAVTPTSDECEDNVIEHASTSSVVAHPDTYKSFTLRRPMARRSTTFKSMLFKSLSGKKTEEGSSSRGEVECRPRPTSFDHGEGSTLRNESISRVSEGESPTMAKIKCFEDASKHTQSSVVSAPAHEFTRNHIQCSIMTTPESDTHEHTTPKSAQAASSEDGTHINREEASSIDVHGG